MKKNYFISCMILILLIPGSFSCKKEDPAPATIEEMLTGGATAVNGKTWVLSGTNYATEDGAGVISPMMATIMGFPDSVLKVNNLGGEYDNEYTFYSDGKFVINPVNGAVLASNIYGTLSGTAVPYTFSALGLCAANYTPPASSTFTLHKKSDMVVENALSDPTTTILPPARGTVTFPAVDWLSFSTGAYMGILDYPSTAKVIIKEITKDKMHVAFLMCGYLMTADPSGAGLPFAQSPTWLVQFTLVPKTK